MSDKISVLFVGGPWDGERRTVNRHPHIVVPELPHASLSGNPTDRSIRNHYYQLQRYQHADGRLEWRYVSEDAEVRGISQT